MHVTLDIPEERAVQFEKQAKARGMSVERWLLDLAEQNTPSPANAAERTLADVCARVQGLTDDLDLSRDPSPGRDLSL